MPNSLLEESEKINNKTSEQKSIEEENWWNEDMRIKKETGSPDLLIFLLNANLKKSRNWIHFAMLNLLQDKEKNKTKLLRLFFLMRSLPPDTLKKNFPKEFEIWEDFKKKLDEDWNDFSKREGFYQYYRLKKRMFCLLFDKFKTRKNESWREWKVLSKASFAHDFHLLGGVICNIIMFYRVEEFPINKEARFEIKFDSDPRRNPDILITSAKSRKEFGIEVVEVSSSLVKFDDNKKSQTLEKFVRHRVEKSVTDSIKKYKKIKPELVENTIKNIKGIELDRKPKEENGIFSASWKTSKKINNFNYLIEKLKETIETKNRRWESKNFKNLSLWTILLTSFAMYLHRADKGYQIVTNESIQRDFLSWFLLKKISETLKDVEIKFDFLIITFLCIDHCSNDSFLNKHDPFKKIEHKKFKESSKFGVFMRDDDIRTAIPNFYIPIRNKKIESLEKVLKNLESRFKEKWKFDINSLAYWETGPISHSFYVSNLDNDQK